MKISKTARLNLELFYLEIQKQYISADKTPPSFEDITELFLRNLVIDEILTCSGDFGE